MHFLVPFSNILSHLPLNLGCLFFISVYPTFSTRWPGRSEDWGWLDTGAGLDLCKRFSWIEFREWATAFTGKYQWAEIQSEETQTRTGQDWTGTKGKSAVILHVVNIE